MDEVGSNPLPRENALASLAVLGLAIFVALVSARDYAGGWNDRSRLATVECLVDHHTLAIDESIFTQGTLDKLWIHGHFYSDKSPVPALHLVVVYQALQATTGLTARHHEEGFCYWMTVASSGLAYVVAVWCVFRLGRPLRLTMTGRLVLTASFALCTMAPAYARHVNNHILLLGVTAPLVLTAAWMGQESRGGPVPRFYPLALGALAGLAYTIDLGAGPVILLATLGLVAHRCRRIQAVAEFGMAALPWLVLHHVVNYAVGGTFGPANAVAEYFQWPGCPFNEETMTGGWKHANMGGFLLYAAGLLDGKRGFLGHNLPLLLALTAIVRLLARRTRDLPEIVFAGCVCGGTWLLYAACSNNSSGLCCSIRWFVPLLAPGYYLLALWIREEPSGLQDLLILSGFGMILAGFMWWEGPWMQHLIKVYWPIQGLALLAWAIAVWRRGQRASAVISQVEDEPVKAAA